jgi:hypothetical protein
VSGFATRFLAADEMPYALASMLLTTLALNLRPTWESRNCQSFAYPHSLRPAPSTETLA